jgi:DNA-directed RNA polymerase subunit K/omega
VTAPPAGAGARDQSRSEAATRDNRFLLSSIAFLRSKQLKNGAAARVALDGHKPTYTAVREVLANTVSWSRV